MKNVIILGSGRSGTSMVTGSLAKSSYFMGNDLLPGDRNNPKGFFESKEINSINEQIIETVIKQRPFLLGPLFYRNRTLKKQRWLASVPLESHLSTTPVINKKIQSLVNQNPFCFKDPRFSYTLPCWRPYLENTIFVCVFREPMTTVQSILKYYRNRRSMRFAYSLNASSALEVWSLMYQHILKKHRYEGEWLFLHYNQALTREGLSRLSAFIEADVDYTFPDQKLKRSQSTNDCPKDIKSIYQELCLLANYK